MRQSILKHTAPPPAPTPSKAGSSRLLGKENAGSTPGRESLAPQGLSGGGARRVLTGKPARTTLKTSNVAPPPPSEPMEMSSFALDKNFVSSQTFPAQRRPLHTIDET